MRALDILAVVSGVAGIISLALMVLERFRQMRPYLAPDQRISHWIRALRLLDDAISLDCDGRFS